MKRGVLFFIVVPVLVFAMPDRVAAESLFEERAQGRSNVEERGRRITEIVIRGNERTRDRTVKDIIRVHEGKEYSNENDIVRKARLKLEKSGLFSYVAVEARHTDEDLQEVTLVVEVEEKWTLVPVPFFTSSGDSTSGGLVLIESNLFGTGNKVITGTTGGSEGFTGFAVFVNPNFMGTRWTNSLSASGGKDTYEIAEPNGETVFRFTDKSVGGSFGLGYRFTDAFSVDCKVRVEQHSVSDVDEPGGESADSNDGLKESEIESVEESRGGVAVSAGYDALLPYGSLMKGYDLSVQGEYGFGSGKPSVEAKAVYNLPTFAGQRLRLVLTGGYGEKALVSEVSVSGRDGFRTLPFGKVTADDFWSGSAAYDIPVYTTEWGAFVLNTFYEYGRYRSSAVGTFDFHGPGGGVRLYLKKIAFPAFGFNAAYNLKSERMVYSVALGMRM